MTSRRSYYMLIASLPPLPVRFDAGRLPITRAALRSRLELLEPDDHAVINHVAEFFVWDRQALDRTDADVIATYQNLMRDDSNPLVRRIVDHRIDMRMIVNAIRRRRMGDGPAAGVGTLTDVIRRNWSEPNFGLSSRYWWVEPFTKAVESGQVRDAQHLLFADLWKTWTRISEQYFFTFEAIILYLARWEIVDRWSSQDDAEGRRRFDDLITETMGDYAKLF